MTTKVGNVYIVHKRLYIFCNTVFCSNGQGKSQHNVPTENEYVAILKQRGQYRLLWNFTRWIHCMTEIYGPRSTANTPVSNAYAQFHDCNKPASLHRILRQTHSRDHLANISLSSRTICWCLYFIYTFTPVTLYLETFLILACTIAIMVLVCRGDTNRNVLYYPSQKCVDVPCRLSDVFLCVALWFMFLFASWSMQL